VTEALKLWVYFGDSQLTGAELTSDALMDSLARRHVAASALCRGIEGFGLNRRIHTERFPDVSTDLPLVACAVDSRERIQALLDDVDHVVADGLVTLEHARLAAGEELADAKFPAGPGRAAKLTIYCGRAERAAVGRRPAYREAIGILRRHGAAGATALLGVDGTYHGLRQRAKFHSLSRNAPLMIISVGRRETLAAALPHLSEALDWPLVTLEGIAQVKHDGEQLEPLPVATGSDREGRSVWQTIRVYTRQSAQVNGRALYTELTRRLREAGAAGATTIRGHWGFSSDEHPYGDRFARLTSHAPTYTTYIDRPAKVAELWPIIDDLTARHGIVTSLFVPAYRERRGEHVHGGLDLAEVLPPTGVERSGDVRPGLA
jgi:PII-like signaling protein